MSVDNKWLPQRVNVEKCTKHSTCSADKKVSECHTVGKETCETETNFIGSAGADKIL